MKKHWNRVAAVICAAVMSSSMTAAVPTTALELTAPEAILSQAGALKTRDVWCAGEDVNRWESEHFQFIWGKSGADSAKITEAFLQENATHLEACWDVYMNELSMEPPTQSVNLSLRDGNEYKVNFYISGTGLSPFEDDWAYMGYDREGYAFMFCCVGAMQNSPNPSWVLPHEFGHVVTAHQRGWNENKYVQAWWESIGNWYREQFLYSDYYKQWVTTPESGTDYFETYMKNLHFTPILGRDNYASWAFLQYLTENPDGLEGYGPDFMKDMMQQGQRDEYPYAEIARLSKQDLKETLGHYAKRLATLDLKNQDRYRARQDELLARGEWNWNQIYTLPEAEETGLYHVPTDRAPQQFGINIIPLSIQGGEISVTLEGRTNAPGADWRACIVMEQMDGKTRYSDLFGAGKTVTMGVSKSDINAYLVVTATPDQENWQQVGVPWAYGEGKFDEDHAPFLGKTRYPYAVTLEGAGIQQTQTDSRMSQGRQHPNGGGFVAATAKVDDSVYVGPNAKVLGYATVTDNAVIDGYAIVTGSAKVSGNAVVTGHAVVAENAQVKDHAIISDTAGVMGRSVVSDYGRVLESALVYDDYNVSGNATVKGTAFCMAKGAATGQAMPDGDYYDDSSRTIQAGSVYGWASPDAYVSSRPYIDGMVACLDFTTDSNAVAADSYTSTFGMVSSKNGSSLWENRRTGADGVMTFNGKDGYLTVDSAYAALYNAEYQTAVLLRDEALNTIFYAGDGEKQLSITAENGSIALTLTDGSTTDRLVAENAYTPGEWFTLSVNVIDGKAAIAVNAQVAATGAVSLAPVSILSAETTARLGADGDGKIMNGSMDYFRVYGKDVEDFPNLYIESEPYLPTELTYYYGDLDRNGEIDVYDLALLKRLVLTVDGYYPSWADCTGDGKVTAADLVAMQKYLHGLEGFGQTGQAVTVYID